MGTVETPDRSAVATVAGIPIVHEPAAGLCVAGDPEADREVGDGTIRPITIRHVVSRVDTTGMAERMVVLDRVRYLEAADGGVVVRIGGDAVTVPSTLSTIDPGYSYVLAHDEAPRGPVHNRGAELTAFALALAARRHGVLAHGCGLVTPSGRGVLALGVSGAGKSTLARMMSGATGWRVLNDDRVVLTRDTGGFRAWATPWPGTAGIAGQGFAQLGAIAFIRRGVYPVVERVAARAVVQGMLRTLLVPFWNAEETLFALDFINEIVSKVPVVELEYPLTDATANWIATTLEGLGE